MIQWHPKTHRENSVILALMAGVILGMVPTAFVMNHLHKKSMPTPEQVITVMCLDLIERQAQFAEIIGEVKPYLDSLDPAGTAPRTKPE